MIRTTKRTVPAHEVTEFVSCTCDLCGAKTTSFTSAGEVNWIGDPFNYHFVTVQQQKGTMYPSDNFSRVWSYHLCPTCYRDKLVPFLESQGVGKPAFEEREY